MAKKKRFLAITSTKIIAEQEKKGKRQQTGD